MSACTPTKLHVNKFVSVDRSFRCNLLKKGEAAQRELDVYLFALWAADWQ